MLLKDGSVPKEKRVHLDTMAVRESLQRDGPDCLRWVPTRHMVADFLTKNMTQTDYVDHVLSRGRLSLVESEEALLNLKMPKQKNGITYSARDPT